MLKSTGGNDNFVCSMFIGMGFGLEKLMPKLCKSNHTIGTVHNNSCALDVCKSKDDLV